MNRLRRRPPFNPAHVAAIAAGSAALWLPVVLATPAAAQLTEQISDAQAAEVPGRRRGGPGGGPAGQRGPRAEISITDAAGEVVRTLDGPAGAGLHTASWNLRGAAAGAEGLSPSERRDSLRVAERARAVADSLVEAGWEEAPLRRQVGLFTGETDRNAFFAGFGGGGFGQGQGGGDPEVFRERQGESAGGGRGGRRPPNFNQMRELAELIRPGVGMRGLFGRRGGGGQGDLVEPGMYTVTISVGDRTLSTRLIVERVGATANSDPASS